MTVATRREIQWNFASFITVGWLSSLVYNGFFTPIQIDDLGIVPPEMQSRNVLSSSFSTTEKTMYSILFDLAAGPVALMSALKCVSILCQVWLFPSLTAQIIVYFEGGDLQALLLQFPVMGFVLQNGLALCLALFATQLIQLVGTPTILLITQLIIPSWCSRQICNSRRSLVFARTSIGSLFTKPRQPS